MADEHYALPEAPVYHEAIRKILNEDPVNADGILNPLIQALLENVHFVKLLAQAKADGAVLDDHIGDDTAHLTAAERSAWNGKAEGNHSHTAADVGARPSTWIPSAADVGAVPTSRKVNGKVLSADISLSAADVSARPSTWMPSAADVGARPSTWTPTAADVGAIPTSQKGVASGVATLGTDAKIPSSQLPSMDYIPTSQKASANGVATLGSDAKVPTSQIPSLDYAPKANPVFTGSISKGRRSGSTTGNGSVAMGESVTASGSQSHAEGYYTVASGVYSHSECELSTASGKSSHAEGYYTAAIANYSHAEGSSTKASGLNSHAEGKSTKATGSSSHAEGENTEASGDYSHSEGGVTVAGNFASHAGGKFSKAMTTGGTSQNTTGDAMVIGNGTSNSALSNAFRVTFAGAVYGVGSFHTSGADYSEYFEWADGNPDAEDRVGRFVTLEGDKLKLAGPGDYLLGIVSGNPCIVGNGDEDWLGRWVHDEFDRFVKEYLEEDRAPLDIPEDLPEEERLSLLTALDVREEDGQYYRISSRVVDYETPSWRLKANPAYDPSQPYIERKDRKEWDTVGMLGVLSVWDDGTCQVNGFCQVAEGGTATAAERYIPGTTYRVIDRVTENVVKVVFR